jgi:hypothetical protein
LACKKVTHREGFYQKRGKFSLRAKPVIKQKLIRKLGKSISASKLKGALLGEILVGYM